MERRRISKKKELNTVSLEYYQRLKDILQQLTSVTSNCKPDCSICEQYVLKWSEHIESSHGPQGKRRSDRNFKNFLEGRDSDDKDFNPASHDVNTGYQSEDEDLDMDFPTEDLDESQNETHTYECNICNKKFALVRSVYRHRRNIHKDTSLPCLVCQENFPSTQALTDHTLQVHPKPQIKKAYECSICQSQFSQHDSLIKHQRNFHQEKSYSCQSCPEKFLLKNEIREHRRLTHGQSKNKKSTRDFLCTDCGKTFVFPYELTRHSVTHLATTSGEKKFKCLYPGCVSSFYVKDHLRKHMRYHGEKSYSCAICGICFNVKACLESHIRIHTGEKPFVCGQCDKSFRTRSALCVHKKRHVGLREHTCEICGKGFVLKHQLITHLRIHTGERRYVCEECGRRFTQPAHLKTHRKGVHKNNKGSSRNQNQFGTGSQELEADLEIQSLLSYY